MQPAWFLAGQVLKFCWLRYIYVHDNVDLGIKVYIPLKYGVYFSKIHENVE